MSALVNDLPTAGRLAVFHEMHGYRPDYMNADEAEAARAEARRDLIAVRDELAGVLERVDVAFNDTATGSIGAWGVLLQVLDELHTVSVKARRAWGRENSALTDRICWNELDGMEVQVQPGRPARFDVPGWRR